ncbi:MAG TPA: hypothetical protein VLM83_01965 [Anaerolineales bacterium]|nr:hypothetical protein [Anaerolineales bacterium]
MSQNFDLASVFQKVTQDLVKNQQSLNQADGYNQNHGDNMVRTFQTITRAVQLKQKQGSSDSAALAYAAKRLTKSSSSASAQLYAQGLSQAAAQFQGKQIDQRSGMQLLQTLIGGGQAAPQSTQPAQGGDLLSSLLGGMAGGTETQNQPSAVQGGDLLSSLLGGLAGASGTQNQPSSSAQGGDLLGSLLGGLTGGSGSGSGLQDGFDLGDLLTVGMAYMQAKQQGKSTMEALVQAFMQVSGMGGSKDRAQSTQLVVSSFLQASGAGGQ